MSGRADAADVTCLVAFDGRPGSEAALRRAVALAERDGGGVLAVSVLPTDERLAATYDLLEDGDYDPDAAAERLRAAAADVAPDAAFRAERVDAYAGKRRIAKAVARAAREAAADVVFLGGDAGRVVDALAGADAVDDGDYDLYLVRSA